MIIAIAITLFVIVILAVIAFVVLKVLARGAERAIRQFERF